MMQFIINLDAKIISLIEPIRTPLLTKVFTLITNMSDWSVLLGVAIVFTIILILKRKKLQDLVFVFITLGALGTAFVLKNLIHRARPLGGLVNETSYSFPSAHAVASVVFYGFIIYLLWQNIRNHQGLPLISRGVLDGVVRIIVVIIVLAIGFSRLYLGVHYFSDVIGGYLIGFIWLVIGIYASKKLNVKARP